MDGVTRAHGCESFFCVYACAPTLVTQCGGPHKMAKALYGHVGGPDPRMVSEMRRLQQRVRGLEAELARLPEEDDGPAAEERQGLPIPVPEPCLTSRAPDGRTGRGASLPHAFPLCRPRERCGPS